MCVTSQESEISTGIIFKKSIVMAFTPEQEIILIGQRTFIVKNTSKNMVKVFKKIFTGVNFKELAYLLPKDRLEKLVSLLNANKLTRPLYKNDFKETRFEKQVDFFSDFVDNPNAAQNKLLNASVCIIGCGGTGNIVVQHLVATGIRNFILIDNDIVDITNFNRQFCFNTTDLATPKVEALRKYIMDRDSDVKVHACNLKINSLENLFQALKDFKKPDIILCCADNPPLIIQSVILQYCIQQNIPCIFGSVGVHDGFVGPLLIDKKHMKTFLQHNKDMLLQFEENSLTNISSSISYLNTLIGALMTEEVIDLIAAIRMPRSLNATLRYSTENQSLIKIYQW